MKSFFQIIILMGATGLLGQTNLVDDSTWTVGTGGGSGVSLIFGTTTRNESLMGTDPHGANSLLWAAVPEGSPTNSQDGGWRTDWQIIDPSKTYRFTVWMKKTGSTSGLSYLGLNSIDNSGNNTTLTFAGNVQSNPYFWWGDLPELDKWYLIIGYIHNSSYSGANLGEMYDGSTGQKVTSVTVTDFKFASNAHRFRHRVLLFADSNASDRQYHWAPTIYEVNGQEPTIQELLDGPNGGSGPTSDLWTSSGSSISYTTGNVGIGITNPTDELEVNGTVHSKGIKANMTGWPDYVFGAEYKLPSLEEIEKYIHQHGHLPNMPSASEVATDGILLGEMNKRLLEKIEELTLYILEENKSLKQTEAQLNRLRNK
ncbi:MAG: hypothetical protein AB3N16_15205 [Flavobacteriaceae bacterium]